MGQDVEHESIWDAMEMNSTASKPWGQQLGGRIGPYPCSGGLQVQTQGSELVCRAPREAVAGPLAMSVGLPGLQWLESSWIVVVDASSANATAAAADPAWVTLPDAEV